MSISVSCILGWPSHTVNRFTRTKSVWRGARTIISIGESDHLIIRSWHTQLFLNEDAQLNPYTFLHE